MSKILFNVKWDETGKPSIETVSQKYGFPAEDIDPQFGVVEIDPQDNLYTILVEEEAAQKVSGDYGNRLKPEEGAFSNPRIEPFDLPSSPEQKSE